MHFIPSSAILFLAGLSAIVQARATETILCDPSSVSKTLVGTERLPYHTPIPGLINNLR